MVQGGAESCVGEYIGSQSKGHGSSLTDNARFCFCFPLLCVSIAEPDSLCLHHIASVLACLLHATEMSGCSGARVKKLFPGSFQSCGKIYHLLWALAGYRKKPSHLEQVRVTGLPDPPRYKSARGAYLTLAWWEVCFFSKQLLVETLYLLLKGMKVLKSFSSRAQWQVLFPVDSLSPLSHLVVSRRRILQCQVQMQLQIWG